MLLLRDALACKILMCYIALSHSVEVDRYSKSWSVSGQYEALVQGSLFGSDDNNYSYAQCKYTKLKVERMCSVSIISPNRIERTCSNVKVFASANRELFFKGYFELWSFTRDHVVLIWYDNTAAGVKPKKQNFHFKILNMASCSSFDVTISIDKSVYGFYPTLLLYPDEVHAIVNSKETCKGDSRCRVVYDLKGKRRGGVMPYRSDLSEYASPVSLQSFAKGFFQTVQDSEEVTVLLINKAGKEKIILEDTFQEEASQNISFSSAHEQYGYCRLPNTGTAETKKKVYCFQYDVESRGTIKSIVEVSEPVNSIAVRNLDGGGLLLTTAGCDRPPHGIHLSSGQCKKFQVYKINKKGRCSKPIDIEGPGFTCFKSWDPSSDHPDVRISENKDKFCFDFSCLESDEHLQFTSICPIKKQLLKEFK